jgi:hypothetical protein
MNLEILILHFENKNCFDIFSLVKEYLSRMNLEILILHFENKNCFDVSLKAFAFENLVTPWFFLGKDIIYSFIW